MHCRTHLLAIVAAVSCPFTSSFLYSTIAANRAVFSKATCKPHFAPMSDVGAAQRRASRRASGVLLAKLDEITDEELEFIQLDPTTLSESEQKRLANFYEMQTKMAEVYAQRRALRGILVNERTPEQRQPTQPAVDESGPELSEGMTAEEKKLAVTMFNIERNLAEVTAIQRELGIFVEEDDEEREREVNETLWRGQAGLDLYTEEGFGTWEDISNRQVLVAGDVFALVMFAYIGRASHGMWALDLGVLATAAPFVAGWLAVSPMVGSYTNRATASMGDARNVLIPSWGISIPVGIFLRALSKGGEIPPASFTVTSMFFTFVALWAWRSLYTLFNPTSRGQFKRAGILDYYRMLTTLFERW